MEISIRQIGYFVRLYELRSFTAAAQSLGITQPALSISISQMENALQVPLIERGLQPIGFTEFGEVLHRYAQRILRDLNHIRDDISALSNGHLGRLDVAISPSAAGFKVGQILAQMCEDYPELEIHVQNGVLSSITPLLLNGQSSLFVGTVGEEGIADNLASEELAEIPLVVAAGANHPLTKQATVTGPDLIRYPWIAIGNFDKNVPGWRDQFAKVKCEPPRIAIDLRNLSVMRDMLIEGQFLTLLPEPMIAADVRAGLLSALQPKGMQWPLQLHVVRRAQITLPSAAQIFVERLRSAFANINKTDD